jgi:anti-anti-sigma regulatory factor
MTLESSPVALMQVPEGINVQQERIFLSQMESCMGVGRPRIVLDCSKLRQMDKAAIHLLLCCLEEALKRNGDVKLAAIPSEASTAFDKSGLEGLFEVFDTTSSAMESFRQIPKNNTPQSVMPYSSHNNTSEGT